ncbi:unnamed protein product [Mesocestoides corti]|uniref:Transmembrane protein n=1 Tax=Mesocestoides corti TaxID=53468 RepID=A0A0R3U121_MESCO|nr:unnamed protein product [Mesocestoides corti]
MDGLLHTENSKIDDGSDESEWKQTDKEAEENSKVYFVFSAEWMAVVSEGQKIYLAAFASFYVFSLLVFCYCILQDSTMVHSLKLKAFLNTRPDDPILQKVNFEAKVIFRTGNWYTIQETIVNPTRGIGGYRKSYPLIRDKLHSARSMYKRCLTTNFRTSPILDMANLFLVVGSVIYVFAGPLVILSRGAFYQCSMLGSVFLGACFLLNKAASGFLFDCLLNTQSIQVDNHGGYKEKLYNMTLFEAESLMEKATTSGLGVLVALLGFLPLAIMGCLGIKLLGRPV